MEQALEGGESVHRMKPGRKPKPVLLATVDQLSGCDPLAAAYAVKVWNGQSPDLPISDRIWRVLNALNDQSLIATDLTMLHPDAARYMEAHK